MSHESRTFSALGNCITTTVDELFVGEKAIEIKERALNIAQVIQYKTLGINFEVLIINSNCIK